MDLIKLIDQNVECVATPNGRYLKRSEVFEVVEKFTSTNTQSTAIAQIAQQLENTLDCEHMQKCVDCEGDVRSCVEQLRTL